MNKGNKFVILITILFVITASSSYSLIGIVPSTNNASIRPLSQDGDELDPIIDYIDFENGTKQTTIDYQNGTVDTITETMLVTYSQMQLGENETDQYLVVETPTSTENCTDWIPMEQELELQQEILMGFTYTILKYRKVLVDIHLNLWLVKAYLEAGINIDISFGLRLPLKIIIEYPEQMTIDKDYTFYATIVPVDKQFYNEFLCTFKCYAYIRAGVWAPFVGWTRYSYTFGPNYDYSKSFETPLGPGLEFPIPDFSFLIWDLWLMQLKLRVDPQLFSDKVTANAKGSGDASCNYDFTWSYPYQKIPFTVHAGDFSGSDKATIRLSDFKYYFSKIFVHFYLDIDFSSWIDWLVPDFSIKVYTLDLSWLIDGLYLGVHSGTISYMKVDLFVEKLGVDLTIFPSDLQVLPNEIGIFELKVKNTGNVIDTFHLYLEDCPLEYSFSTEDITLDNGQTGTVQLSITQGFDPLAILFYVHAYSLTAEERGIWKADTVAGSIEVEAFYAVDVSILPDSPLVKPGTTILYDVEVKNTGNIEDSYDISIECINFASSWAILDTDHMSLGPSEVGYAIVQITVPNDWTGMENTGYSFKVSANSEETNDVADGILIVEATKDSKARYINIELFDLTYDVITAPIDLDLKNSILDHLTAATEKKDQALDYILEDRNAVANNMLKACKNMLNAMISLISAQTQIIPEPLPFEWINATETIIVHIEDTIITPI